jgi:hypothetical protein
MGQVRSLVHERRSPPAPGSDLRVKNIVTRANRKEPFARVFYLLQPPKGVCKYIILKKESDPR